jgi:hypothetical protein
MKFLIFLFVYFASTVDVTLLHYNFKGSETIVTNSGNLLSEYDSLGLVGAPINSEVVQLSTKSPNHYISKMIPSIKRNIIDGDGFNITVNINIPRTNNVYGEFCIFCLLRKEIFDTKSINICHDVDFGIIWRNGYLKYVVRNSKTTPTCDNLMIEAYIKPDMIQANTQFHFIFDKQERSIYHNSKLLIKSKDIHQDQDITNWANEHAVFIGAIKESAFISLLQLNEVQLSQRQVKKTSYAIAPTLQEFNKHKQQVTIEAPDDLLENFIEKTPKTCKLNDVKCLNECQTPDVCGVCKGNGNMCSSYLGAHPIDSKCILSNTKCHIMPVNTISNVFDQEYLITIDASVYEDKSNTVHGILRCLNGKTIKSDFKYNKTIKSTCDKTKQLQYTQTVKYRDLYECFTGKFGTIDSTLRHIRGVLTIENVLTDNTINYKVPCVIGIGANIQQLQNSRLNNSIITHIQHNNKTLFTVEKMRYSKDNDINIIYKTCYSYHSRTNQNQNMLDSITLNNNMFTVVDISAPVVYLSGNNPLQCHTWKVKSIKHFLLNKVNSRVNLIVTITISNQTDTLNLYIDINNPPAKKVITIKPIVNKEQEWTQVLCLFNDAKMSRPYHKNSKSQVVYFRAELVHKSDIPTYHCGSMLCRLPSLTIRLQSLGSCVPRKALLHDKTARCDDLNGDLTNFIDLSDPTNEIWDKKWDPKVIDSGCPSAIMGSFIEMSHTGKLFMFPSLIQISLDTKPTQTQLKQITNNKLNKQQITSTATHHYISPTIIGGCPSGLYYDEFFFNDCVQSTFWYFGWCWIKFRWFLVGFAITFIVGFIIWMHYHKAKVAHKHHKKLNQRNKPTLFTPYKTDASKFQSIQINQ